MIVHELVASLEAELGKLKVKKAVIGLRYACVILSDDSCGLAAVLDEGYRCSGYNWSAPLAGSSALELARGLLTADPDFVFLRSCYGKCPAISRCTAARNRANRIVGHK